MSVRAMTGIATAIALIGASPAAAKPCAEHVGSAKTACVKQVARDRMAWPPNPTWAEIVKRARPGELAALRKIAECEQPGSGSFPYPAKYGPRGWRTAWGINAGATYVGAYGMYRGTAGIGAAATSYDVPPYATPAEETGTAMIVARRFGYSAWGCW